MRRVLKLFGYVAVARIAVFARVLAAPWACSKGEYFVLALFALLGIMVMVSAGSLVTVYLGVELLALSLYALVAIDRDVSPRRKRR